MGRLFTGNSRQMKSDILVGALAIGLAGNVFPADWPQFRGPNGSSVSLDANPPIRLDGESSVSWKVDLPGEGLSAPIVVDGRVILTCSSGPGQNNLHVIALDPQNGRALWERTFWSTGRTMHHEKTAVAAPTPVSDGRRIYALFSSNDLVCLDLDGNVMWIRGLTMEYPNVSNSLGMASSPVIAGSVLVTQVENDSESYAIGIDLESGANVWKLDRPKAANWTSPTVLHQESGPVVLLQSSAGIDAIDAASGQTLCAYTEGAATIPSSVLADGIVYAPSFGITAMRPDWENGVFETLWRGAPLRPGTASPVVVGAQLFVVNGAGVLTCASIEDGERLWQLRLKGPFSATPVAVGQRLYLFNENGLAQVVDYSSGDGEVVSEMDLGETILASPAVADDAIFVRSDHTLWKLGASLVL